MGKFCSGSIKHSHAPPSLNAVRYMWPGKNPAHHFGAIQFNSRAIAIRNVTQYLYKDNTRSSTWSLWDLILTTCNRMSTYEIF